jgi:hypothetical protein
MIIHIPLYKRGKYLRCGGQCADMEGQNHRNGWLYLRLEVCLWKGGGCGGRDSSDRTRLYYTGWYLDCAIGLSVGRTEYSVIHDNY